MDFQCFSMISEVFTKISASLAITDLFRAFLEFSVDLFCLEESINGPVKLGQARFRCESAQIPGKEASCINQNFSQMVLDHEAFRLRSSKGCSGWQEPIEEMGNPNPFEDEDLLSDLIK